MLLHQSAHCYLLTSFQEFHTIRLPAETLSDSPLFFKVNVPCGLLAGGVLEYEGVDAGALLDGVFAVCFVLEGSVDGVEGGAGGEGVYRSVSCVELRFKRRVGEPSLTDMSAVVYDGMCVVGCRFDEV